jgi:hypothetical protein
MVRLRWLNFRVDGGREYFGESGYGRSTKERYREKDIGREAQQDCAKNYILKVRIQFFAVC